MPRRWKTSGVRVGLVIVTMLGLLAQQGLRGPAQGDSPAAMAMAMPATAPLHMMVSRCTATGCKTLALVRRGNGYVATARAAAATQSVMIMNFAFAPQNLTINVGDTITWSNHDSAHHTVTSDPGSAELNSGDLAQDQSYTHTFTTAGTFPYHCDYHPKMLASITVLAAGAAPAATSTAIPTVAVAATSTAPAATSTAASSSPATTTAGLPAVSFQAVLSGTNEVDSQGATNKGAPAGSGLATVTLAPSLSQICYTIAVTGVTLPAAAAHIHVGAAGANGNVVVPLTAPDASGNASGCVSNVAADLIAAIAANPAGYYVNVHTSDFPAGAVRGQLAATTSLAAVLSGANEVDSQGAANKGAPAGSGVATITLKPTLNQICYTIAVTGVTLPAAAAHIHNSLAGANGNVVVPLTAPDASGNASGCVSNVATALINTIAAEPASYYVNVHTSDFPAGAVRGQLAPAMILQAALSGANEVDSQGAANKGATTGGGLALVTLLPGLTQVCYVITATNITLPAAAAHIHIGAAGSNGNVVLPLTAPDATGRSVGCASNVAADLIAAIAANPAGYYVNVHTSDFPAGAVRGQLVATTAPTVLRTFLSGANEVDSQGAANKGSATGSGSATVTVDAGLNRICYTIAVTGVTLPAAAAHIHVGAAGANGNVVVPLTAPDASGNASGCVSNVAADLIAAIAANPAGYYVNVHTSDFPAGAVRGQLASLASTPPAAATPVPTTAATSSSTQTPLPTLASGTATAVAATETPAATTATAQATVTPNGPPTLAIHNAPRTVKGGHSADCDLQANLTQLTAGCVIVSSISAPGATISYSLLYPGSGGQEQKFTDTADFRGHSLHIFGVAYLPPAGSTHGSPLTVVKVTVSATLADGSSLGPVGTRFVVMP